MNPADYPKNWKAISAEIRERAKNADGIPQCECTGECGLHRGRSKAFASGEPAAPKRCAELHGHPARWAKGKVILTTAHLCHNTKCARRKHLKAMCNRCHLRIDVKLHARHRRERKERETGQTRLFPRE